MESLDGSDRQPPFAQRPLMIEHRAMIRSRNQSGRVF
jgi:hypothetical protein